MKQFVVIAGLLVMSTISYANPAQSTLDKNSQALKALGSAFTSQQTIHPDQNDITIVYGGEDFSSRTPIDKPSAVA